MYLLKSMYGYEYNHKYKYMEEYMYYVWCGE